MSMPEANSKSTQHDTRNLTTSTFTGIVDAALYDDVKRYLVPPLLKIMGIALLVAEAGIAVWSIVSVQNYYNLILLAIIVAVMILFYRNAQKRIVRNACASHPELTEGGMQVSITMGSAIRLKNHTSGAEHNLSYSEIYSMAETQKAIICFTRKGKKRRYLLIPKTQMKEGQRDQVISLLTEHCGKLKKRL